MISSTKEILLMAQEGGYAVGAFNTCNLEITKAIFKAGEKLRSPLIIQTSQGEFQHGQGAKLFSLIKKFAQDSNFPVAINLDHGKDLKIIQEACDLGYSSVMFDGSSFSFQENIEKTKKVVNLAHSKKIDVEGELGLVPTPKKGERINQILMTDPNQAEEFVRKTEIDFLAVGIGNLHGAYKGKPQLDFERLEEIKKRVDLPLVLHGGSGIKALDIKKAVSLGICKINVNTELRLAFANTLRKVLSNPDMFVPYKIMKPVEEAIQKVVEEKIKIFGSKDKV